MLAGAMGEADLASDRLAGSLDINAGQRALGGRWPGELWYQRDPEPLRDKCRRDRVVGGLKRESPDVSVGRVTAVTVGTGRRV